MTATRPGPAAYTAKPRCQTCLKWDATWRASRGYDSWLSCDACKAQATKYRVKGITYVQLERRPTRRVDAPTAHVPPTAAATSQAMQAKALGRSGTLRATLAATVAKADRGMTDDELEQALDRAHQSVSAARNRLVADGWLRDSGRTRRNRYGNDAIVWLPSRALLDHLGDDR